MWILGIVCAWVYLAGVVAPVIVARPYQDDDARWWSPWIAAAIWPADFLIAAVRWAWRSLRRRRSSRAIAAAVLLLVTASSLTASPRLFRVTAYCPCRLCCGPHACRVTASGRPAVGLLCAAPRSIPFGTVLDIPGYGQAVVADRGGAIKGDRLDVLFPTHAAARAWGVRWVLVHVSRGS